MKSNVKLIITDLDQTLLRSDKSISPYSLETIENCKTQGIRIAIATARSETAAKKYIDLINPDIIISNGGALVNCYGKTIYKCMLAANTSDKLIQQCLCNHHVSEITAETESDCYWNNKGIAKSSDYSHVIYYDFSIPLNCKTYKITVKIFDKNTALQLKSQFDECNMTAFTTFTGEHWYAFAHKYVTKMYAIKQLSHFLNITSDDIAAFGDGYNDIEMLACCGYGVAVSNAIDEVLKSANYFTESNDEDGVAKFININFLL